MMKQPVDGAEDSVAAAAATNERNRWGSIGSSWPGLCPALLAIVAFLLLYPTAMALLSEWRDEANTTTYTHGFLVAALCLWLLVRNRAHFQNTPIVPSPAAFVLLLGSGFVWLVAVRGGIQTVHEVLLPVLTWLAVYAAMGRRAAVSSAFAIGYLYFAIPIWGHVNEALQHGTVVVVEMFLRISGVPAYVEGNFVHLASGVIEIAHGCSGLHYFIVALAIGALYGELHRDSLRMRAQQILLAGLCALFTNWLRVYIIIVAGYLTDMQHYLVRESHYKFGWFVFAAVMTGFFLIVRRMEPAAAESPEGAPAAPLDDRVTRSMASLPLSVALAVIGLAAAPLWNVLGPADAARVPHASAVLPTNPASWSGPSASRGSWSPEFVNADVQGQGDYSALDDRVEVFVAMYGSQSQGKELVGYNNSIMGDSSERIIQRSKVDVAGPAIELVLETPTGARSVLWYFYNVGSLQTDRGVVAQVWYGLSALYRAPLSRVVAVRTQCVGDCDDARSILRKFIHDAELARGT